MLASRAQVEMSGPRGVASRRLRIRVFDRVRSPSPPTLVGRPAATLAAEVRSAARRRWRLGVRARERNRRRPEAAPEPRLRRQLRRGPPRRGLGARPAALPTRRPFRSGSRVLLDAAKEYIAKEVLRLGVSSKRMMFAKICPRTSQDWMSFESLVKDEASQQRHGYAISLRMRAAFSSTVQCGPLPNTKNNHRSY